MNWQWPMLACTDGAPGRLQVASEEEEEEEKEQLCHQLHDSEGGRWGCTLKAHHDGEHQVALTARENAYRR